MTMRLKYGTETHDRILKAEQALSDIGISISYEGVHGIIIKDEKSGREFRTIEGGSNVEYNFPRTCDCEFILIDD